MGTEASQPLPNYRRLVYLNSRDSLELATSLLRKYYRCPNFQMAAFGSCLFPINFEVFISDDKRSLVAFGAEQAGGPLEAALYVRNPRVAAKWRSFFMNLWEHDDTVCIKGSGSLTEEECASSCEALESVFAKTKR